MTIKRQLCLQQSQWQWRPFETSISGDITARRSKIHGELVSLKLRPVISSPVCEWFTLCFGETVLPWQPSIKFQLATAAIYLGRFIKKACKIHHEPITMQAYRWLYGCWSFQDGGHKVRSMSADVSSDLPKFLINQSILLQEWILFLWILSMCELWEITHKLSKARRALYCHQSHIFSTLLYILGAGGRKIVPRFLLIEVQNFKQANQIARNRHIDDELELYWNMSHLMTKPTEWHVRPAKTQISLGIRPVWSESSLSAWRKFGSLATHWAHSKDSDQTG